MRSFYPIFYPVFRYPSRQQKITMKNDSKNKDLKDNFNLKHHNGKDVKKANKEADKKSVDDLKKKAKAVCFGRLHSAAAWWFFYGPK